MMNKYSQTPEEKNLCIGLLAHVDAGKTTLAESLLYLAGMIRKQGRVDHRDAHLDTDEMERDRGITIFSKQAVLRLPDGQVTLLDTPGHEDFTAEMQRTLAVLDYAVLIVSGADGVRGHDERLWELLKNYQIPVFLFINKMDQPGIDRETAARRITENFGEHCIDFGQDMIGTEVFYEALAVCDEDALEEYLRDGKISDQRIRQLIWERKVFPCWYGSALKNEGVLELLKGLSRYTMSREGYSDFGALVYKISRDEKGMRLTHLKVTGGSLKVKQQLTANAQRQAENAQRQTENTQLQTENTQRQTDPEKQVKTKEQSKEVPLQALADRGGRVVEVGKADQIRRYLGASFELLQEAPAGIVCAITGPAHTYAGQGLGVQPDLKTSCANGVLRYRMRFPEGSNLHEIYQKLRQLEEELPEIHVSVHPNDNGIYVHVMGEVQIEVLKNLVFKRCGVEPVFDAGSIVYRETIAVPVEGVGHFEPLRHYAEVHLLMEPLPQGSGLVFAADCPPDSLDLNWQRLVLTHLAEQEHPGVLTGAPITDMKITLRAGRAHQKHTQGGDFREATCRAVRQGLKSAQSVLLEPVYEFRLEVPDACAGRAIHDIQMMQGSFKPPQSDGKQTILRGIAPVAGMREYAAEVISYTRGEGALYCEVCGYAPCQDAQSVITQIGYDSETDAEHPTGSVFCAHGSGYTVPWNEVPKHMHLPSCLQKEVLEDPKDSRPKKKPREEVSFYDDKELSQIFERTYGPIDRRRFYGHPDPVRETQPWADISQGPDSYTDDSQAAKPPADISQDTESHADILQAAKISAGISQDTEFTADYDKMREPAKGRPEYRPQAVRLRSAGSARQKEEADEYLLVDGYNIIFSWEDLNLLAKENMDSARMKLADILCNYQGYRKNTLILVFDAYKVEGGRGEIFRYKNIYIVYTKEAETADQYIEKTVHQIGNKKRVTVATSDGTEQVIILGQGAVRMSARELQEEIWEARRQILAIAHKEQGRSGSYLMEDVSEEMALLIEDVRLGYRRLDGQDQDDPFM